MNKAFIPWIGVGIIVIFGIFMLSSGDGSPTASSGTNVTTKDGIQYVTVNVKGGYNPRNSSIQGNIPTKLVMKTNGTYDCSSSLVIRSINYRSALPATGETEIDLGTPKPGEKIQGTCGMGMYSFSINVT